MKIKPPVSHYMVGTYGGLGGSGALLVKAVDG